MIDINKTCVEQNIFINKYFKKNLNQERTPLKKQSLYQILIGFTHFLEYIIWKFITVRRYWGSLKPCFSLYITFAFVNFFLESEKIFLELHLLSTNLLIDQTILGLKIYFAGNVLFFSKRNRITTSKYILID
jgi:hypothetical protein